MSNKLLRPQSEMHPLERMITLLEEKHMSIEPPSLESRMRAQERMTTLFNARFEELEQDMDTSFKQVAAYYVHSEQVIETRFNGIDTRFDKVDTRIQQLAQDMDASFKQVVAYHVHSEQVIETRFNEVEARLDKVEVRLDKVEARLDNIEVRLDKVEARLDNIEATMVTKEDLAKVETRLQESINAIEVRVFDGFKQMITMIDLRLPPPSHGG